MGTDAYRAHDILWAVYRLVILHDIMPSSSTLIVNASTGVEPSYIDSGAPAQASYMTIFAIHGMIFTKG